MIRDMQRSDIDAVTILASVFNQQSVYSRWKFNFGRTAYILEEIINTEDVFAQVLVLDDKVVGFFVGQITTNEWVDCDIASDLAFYIQEEHRKGTWGVRLIKNFEAWALPRSDMIKLSVFAGVANDRVSDLLDRMNFVSAGTIHKKETQPCV